LYGVRQLRSLLSLGYQEMAEGAKLEATSALETIGPDLTILVLSQSFTKARGRRKTDQARSGTMIPLQLSYIYSSFLTMSQEPKSLCRLCLQTKKLIKAHIIPEGFIRPLRSEGIAPEMHINSPGSYPRRMPVGPYDPSILCGDCDRKMGPWDDYAQELLLKRFPEASVLQLDQQKVCWLIEGFDYPRLKLFFISLLWRASVSQQEFFKSFSVGPFEDQLRTLILNGKLGSSQSFAVILARFGDSDITAMLSPQLETFEGVLFSKFYLTGFLVYIKVDQKPTPSLFADYCMRENSSLIVLSQNLHNSPDGSAMREHAESAMSKKRAWSREGTD
jgi:hypothetical protein